jgi:O-antigen ligase
MSDRSSSHAIQGTARESHAGLGWIALWLAMLLAVTGAGLWLFLHMGRAGAAYPGLSPTVPLAADKTYGVSVDLTHYAGDRLEDTLARMQAMGLGWIRQPFRWGEIEPARGQFDWAAADRVVSAARAHHLQLVAVLDTTPNWARSASANPFTPPAELVDFGNFARALAARYGDQIDYYQIWDEPNLSAHWGDKFVDPAGYARLLREGAINIRAMDPKTTILAAALAPTLESGPLNLNEPAFLAGLYAANAAAWFDVIAAQPYGFDQEPAAAPDNNRLNFARTELVRQTMLAYGDQAKAIWATSFGWSSLPQPWEGAPSPWPSLPPERQAAYTLQAIRHARSNWSWLGPIFFAAWDAQTLPADDPRRGLALVSGQAPRPPAQALLDLDSAGGNYSWLADEIASVGAYPADHPSGHYTGEWRLTPLGADVPRYPPARLEIPFEGTRLDLSARRGLFRAFLYVTIDGQPANQLPEHNGRAYLVLYDPLEREASLTLARYLPDGPHMAVIEAEGGWYQWPVAGWRVSREADTRSLGLGLMLVAGLGVVTLLGLANTTRRLPQHEAQRAVNWGQWLAAGYMALGTPIHLLLLAAAAVAFYLAPGTLISLGVLGLLFLLVLPRPDLGLALVAFSLPFFLLPKPLIGRTISVTEIGLLLVALAHVARRTLTLLNRTVSQASSLWSTRLLVSPSSWLDRSAWLLTGLAALAGALSSLPAAQAGLLALIDWPTWTLMLLPAAGVLAGLASREASRMSGLDLAVAAIVVLALAATLAAENLGVSLQEFHVVVWDGAAFYAFLRLTRRQNSQAGTGNAQALAWLLLDAFLLGTTAMALYAMYQFFFTDQSITAEGVHRALGLYGSPNNLALLLDRALPIAIAVAVFSPPALPGAGPPAGPDKPALGRIQRRRLLYGLAIIPMLITLLLTFSRGALMLGLPAAVLFMGIVLGGRALWAALGVLAATGVGFVPFFGTHRFQSMFDLQSGTAFFRLRLWQSAWTMLREHLWLGVGLDNFLYQYRTRYILPDAWQEPNLSHPHNIVLDFGTRLGIGGIVLLLWLQLAFWRVAWRLYRHPPDAAARTLILALMASMVAILAHGLVDNSFFLVDLAFIFFLITGVISKLEAVEQSNTIAA